MKKNHIDLSKFEDAILAAGWNITDVDGKKKGEGELNAKEQAGFIKVPGATGRIVYVSRTKTVARVDLSGFTAPEDVKTIKMDVGAVKQGIDFRQDEEKILADFAKVLEHLKTLPAREKEVKAKPGQITAAKGGEPPVAKLTDEQKAARRDLIKKVAEEKGVQVSPDTEAALR